MNFEDNEHEYRMQKLDFILFCAITSIGTLLIACLFLISLD